MCSGYEVKDRGRLDLKPIAWNLTADVDVMLFATGCALWKLAVGNCVRRSGSGFSRLMENVRRNLALKSGHQPSHLLAGCILALWTTPLQEVCMSFKKRWYRGLVPFPDHFSLRSKNGLRTRLTDDTRHKVLTISTYLFPALLNAVHLYLLYIPNSD